MGRRPHVWTLSKSPWYSRDESCTTIFSWRCRNCSAEVNTSTSSGSVGTHGAQAYLPSDKRLARVGILLDCDEEAVRQVLVA